MPVRMVQAKKLISRSKSPDPWFGMSGTVNLYRGCTHGCIYCDSRSLCYGVENFDQDILIKENFPELLPAELKAFRGRGVLGFGSMSDSYMPPEKDLCVTRRALEIISEFRQPLLILTKSDLVLRDLDILSDLASRTRACVAFTVTTPSDSLAQLIEPGASPPSRRFLAMKALAHRGIMTGTTLMPVLPFLQDRPEHIIDIIEKTAQAGGSFVLASVSVTLRDRQRDYFYRALDHRFPGLKQRYQGRYGDSYGCDPPAAGELKAIIKKRCRDLGLDTRVPEYALAKQTHLFEQK